MGYLDQVQAALGSVAAAEAPSLISAALAKTGMGNLQGIVTRLEQGGLGDQVKSWVSNGPNVPVTADQLQAALGADQVKQLAQRFGIPRDAALKFLADHLPAAVDQASPDGKLPSD